MANKIKRFENIDLEAFIRLYNSLNYAASVTRQLFPLEIDLIQKVSACSDQMLDILRLVTADVGEDAVRTALDNNKKAKN